MSGKIGGVYVDGTGDKSNVHRDDRISASFSCAQILPALKSESLHEERSS